MDRTETTARNMLSAIDAPLYDVGVLSDRGMLPGRDRIFDILIGKRIWRSIQRATGFSSR